MSKLEIITSDVNRSLRALFKDVPVSGTNARHLQQLATELEIAAGAIKRRVERHVEKRLATKG